MRRCPYCAEEIQDKAKFCRYCARRVRGRYKRLIFCVIAVAIIAWVYFDNRSHVDFHIAQFASRCRAICRYLEEMARELPSGLKAMKSIKSEIAEIPDNIIGR